MTSTLTRAHFLAGIAGLGALSAAGGAHAARDRAAETYVQEHATAALRTLGDRSMSAAQRRQTFERLMAQFADMPRIAIYVLGRYGAQLRADAALRAEWIATFQDYAIATYEDRFENFNGSSLRVVGSIERTPGRDVIVQSQLQPRSGGAATNVEWRVLNAGGAWRVFDVSIVDRNRNQIWLAQLQAGEFLAALDRNRGDIRALMVDVRGQTAQMRDRVTARS